MIICAALIDVYAVVGAFLGAVGPIGFILLCLVSTALSLVSILIDSMRSS